MSRNNKQKELSSPNSLEFDSFKKAFSRASIGSESDVNFLDCIHLSENDHTNILWQILQYKRHGQYPFLKSFVEDVLGLPYYQNFGVDEPLVSPSGTQCRAIGLGDKKEPTGFIDLLLKSPRKVFIIENKVCGAGDMDWQLLRYYYSFVTYERNANIPSIQNNSKNFETLYDNFKENTKETCKADDVFLIYLTKDGSKEPEEKSIGNLRKTIGDRYIPVSYFGDDYDDRKCIFNWLKEDVLPNVPYIESGHFLQSLILYVNYLENSFDDGGNMPLDASLYKKLEIENLNIKDLIFAYKEEFNNNKKNTRKENSGSAEEENLRTKYLKFIKACINYKLIEIANEVNIDCKTDWIIRWDPHYIMLFRKAWFDNPNYSRTPNISFMHWELLKWFNNSNADFSKWEFHLEGPHLGQCVEGVKNELKLNESTKSGHIKNVLTLKNKAYILNEDEDKIKNYLDGLFKYPDFKEITEKIEQVVNNILNQQAANSHNTVNCLIP